MADSAIDPNEALQASLNKLERLADGDEEMIAELTEHALREIDKAERAADPRNNTYVKRLDTNTVVRSDAEYEFCSKNNIPLGTMTYQQAVASFDLLQASARAEKKRKQQRKVKKAARKRNR